MIESFRDRRLKRFYERGESSKLQPALIGRIETILGRLDIALSVDDLDLHSFHLHPLTGDLKGFWSITVRANWRIIFRIENGAVFDVALVDYH